MGYNVTDILVKSIKITIKRKELYKKIGEDCSGIPAMRILAKVLIDHLDKSISFYENLKKDLEDTDLEDIDFAVYDKIAFLINEFDKRVYVTDVKNPRDFLELSLSLEKDAYSVLVDIQGRLVKGTGDVHTKTYKILSAIIADKDKHIETIKKTIK